MNLKKKLKKLFTFARRNDGFTLVELVVVIAILGVLAGVGTVGYSGYVKKANLAADEQLLNSINTAFAVACIENNKNIQDVNQVNASNAKLVINADKTWSVEELVNDKVEEAFDRYIADGKTAKFKVIERVSFDNDLYKFIYDISDLVKVGYYGNDLYFSSAYVAKLKASTFYTNNQLGTDKLLDRVNFLTQHGDVVGHERMKQVLESKGFSSAAAAALGVEPSDLDGEMTKLVTQMVANNPGMTPEQAQSQIEMNAVVLYAAQNSTKMSTAEVTALLSGTGAREAIIDGIAVDSGKALSQAAVAYGMYTAYAYANDTGDGALIALTESPLEILNGLDDPDFQKYIKTEQGQKDLEGYLASMNIINSTTENSAAVKELMLNGFADDKLKEAVQEGVNDEVQ